MEVSLEHIARMLEMQAGELERLRAEVECLRRGPSLDVLSTKEVCEVLGIGRTKLHELIDRGELKMWKLDGKRKITRAGLEAFIRNQAKNRN